MFSSFLLIYATKTTLYMYKNLKFSFIFSGLPRGFKTLIHKTIQLMNWLDIHSKIKHS